MTVNRRNILTALCAIVAALVVPIRAWAARPNDAFDKEEIDAVLRALFNNSEVEPGEVSIKAPDMAEIGEVVPIFVNFNMAGVEEVSILAENNPNPLAVSFELSPRIGGNISTRIKLAKDSHVYAVIKAGNKLYSASKEVRVTIGGCGG